MGSVGSYDEKTINEFKAYLSSYDLRLKIKSILSDYSVEILNRVEKGFDVDSCDFNDVVEDYFEQLQFNYHNYDDSNVCKIKEQIGNLFSYVDSLDLDPSYKMDLIRNFFSRFSDDINESRGFYELITLDSIRNSDIMNDYLNSDLVGGKYALFTKKLYLFLDELSLVEQEKVNYVFRSSYEALAYFLENKDVQLSSYFIKSFLVRLTKEELSVLFRTSYLGRFDKFFASDERFLKVVLMMRDYVLERTGRSIELFDSLFRIFDNERDSLLKIYTGYFIEYYERFYDVSVSLEDDDLFNELLSFTYDCNGDLYIIKNSGLLSLSYFQTEWVKMEDSKYENALLSGRIGLLKLKLDLLDTKYDLFNYNDIEAVKNLYFSRMYGLYYQQARFLYNKYGRFINLISSEIDDKDRDTYQILKSICDVYKMDLRSRNNYIGFQNVFLGFIKREGIYRKTDGLSFVSLRDNIDRMYQNSFNRVLFKVDNGIVLKKVRGVPIIDPGVNFNMVVNAVNGVGEFFEVEEGFNIKYNTSNSSNNSGICASFINNENLGVVSLKGPLLGYSNLDLCNLHAMGIGDIYSETETMSLKNSNSGLGEGKYFATPKVLIDNTRFGYNELVLDRFYQDDVDNKIKVQPSYIVVYKIDDNYTKTRMYKRGLRMAKEFGVPLVLVDVEKVKENEKNIINVLEEELFSHREVNKDLMDMIITRYMNNYTGSLTITRSRKDRGNGWKYSRDFSEDGLNNFLDKLDKRLESLTYVEIREWNDAIRSCYEKERQKNCLASEICEYGCSLTKDEFLLKDMLFLEMAEKICSKHIDRYLYDCGLIEIDKVIRIDDRSDIRTVVNLANYIYECSYVIADGDNCDNVYFSTSASLLSEEEKSFYGLVISYLFGNYEKNYFDSLHLCNDKIKFNIKNKNLLNEVNSGIFSGVTKSKELMKIVEDISMMDIDKFMDIFNPLIDSSDKSEGITKVLATRKSKIRSDFSKLPEKEKVKVKKSGD